jgi:hypothetical protein
MDVPIGPAWNDGRGRGGNRHPIHRIGRRREPKPSSPGSNRRTSVCRGSEGYSRTRGVDDDHQRASVRVGMVIIANHLAGTSVMSVATATGSRAEPETEIPPSSAATVTLPGLPERTGRMTASADCGSNGIGDAVGGHPDWTTSVVVFGDSVEGLAAGPRTP